ncbi:helix-turn-helix transcriptional regulator [Chitinivorax sp. B]|uniref:helix-turn-helix domain-containing protein n=1 Tax=Chitinivorax sp. B TaxID=2502235 RepID=UPI0010F46086|nr:helix-turn-helix transcriptional regulator [Chitinivorax sp. B]
MESEAAFGQVLRRLRKERNLTQEALALEANVQRTYVSMLERGQNSASIRMVFKLAPLLGVRPSEILAQVEEELGPKK